jgi:hypothetical protein
MARVANCPQCENEFFVPDDANDSALAKCPACRAFFALKDANSRELAEVLLVESQAPNVHGVPMIDSSANDPGPVQDLAATERPYAGSASSDPIIPETPEAAAERIDHWFRSAKTLVDLPQPEANPHEENTSCDS